MPLQNIFYTWLLDMHRPIFIFLLFLVLFATNIDPLPQNYDPVRFDSTRVTIRSEINDPLPLRVHCRSKTEDLGAQALDYGEVFFNIYHKNIYFKTYDFSFRANQDTCYWCKLYRWKKENGDSALYKTLIDAWGR